MIRFELLKGPYCGAEIEVEPPADGEQIVLCRGEVDNQVWAYRITDEVALVSGLRIAVAERWVGELGMKQKGRGDGEK